MEEFFKKYSSKPIKEGLETEFKETYEYVLKLFTSNDNGSFLTFSKIFKKLYPILDSETTRHHPYTIIGDENEIFVLSKFANEFCNRMKKLMFPQAYSLSFTAQDSIINPVMWSHYSNNHKGVCLEFDKKQIEIEIKKYCKKN